ncbi:MAG: excinuclease ABC subunit UvrC [SAR324 cluster bacterium]|nr:excinuclease ABC subunit UvrC [SAR324 cluster bacterium]MBL7034940.1 excinuclease ABC subunit UvrC [SAR324 cluster bacterium]
MKNEPRHAAKGGGDISPALDKLSHLPDLPGVYLFKDEQQSILYIGKSKSIRNRVRSYFHSSAKHNLRIMLMVSRIHDFSLIVTDTEAEALILEEQLIKKHHPRYNVALKDGKTYPYCKLTVGEMYPRLLLVREKIDADSEYYGPYTSVKDARQVLKAVMTYFPLRTSKMQLDGQKKYRPCLNFQMKRCLAPCRGDISAADYGKIVRQVRLFLKGRDRELLQELEMRMQQSSKKLEFEKSAQYRDQIQAVSRIFERQMVLDVKGKDQDVFNLFRESDATGVQVLFIRNGRLLGTDFFYFEDSSEASADNILGQVLHRIYMPEGSIVPREILLPFEYSDRKLLEDALNQKSKHRVYVVCPQKGRKKELVTMAYSNAKVNLSEQRIRSEKNTNILRHVKFEIKLKRLPELVEAFDISHLSGTMTVASMVCWKYNQPANKDYRKYKIKSLDGPDDYASMKEVLNRRYSRTLAEGKKLPDLILIDGGKGQINIAEKVLAQLGILDKVDLIGLAKGRSARKMGRNRGQNLDYEYVVKPKQKNEIRLRRNSDVLYFLQNIRDESHRFAIEFQRKLKRKSTLHSKIDEIPGIGPKRRKLLLKHFGSLTALRQASIEEILQVPGVPEKLAEEIFGFLQN